MKKIVFLSLVLVVSLGVAQEEKKRPSWSQGLPEREVAPQPGKPAINPVPAETPEFEIKPEIEPINAGLEMEIDTKAFAVPKPVIEPVTTLATEDSAPSAANRREALEQYFAGDDEASNEQQQELIKQYKWSVLKTSPIQIPSDYKGSDSLKLHIQINPKGRVVRVTKADSNIPEYVVESAERSIKGWRFEPPGDLGINEVIGKTFTIDVMTDA
ncbi:MAG: hypothetical protein R3E90_12170 [Marinicella sp.]|nr:hypothetical protein [Xanthomonadales bacterium]